LLVVADESLVAPVCLSLRLDWLSRSHLLQIERPAVQVFEPNPLLEISLKYITS
jgi:hypothetical protein